MNTLLSFNRTPARLGPTEVLPEEEIWDYLSSVVFSLFLIIAMASTLVAMASNLHSRGAVRMTTEADHLESCFSFSLRFTRVSRQDLYMCLGFEFWEVGW